MRIASLSIDNLRNLAGIRLAPGPHLNLLYGHNGAGKTSVLEALVLLAKGRSFRTGAFSTLIGPEGPLVRVLIDFETEEGQAHRIGMERDRDQWRGRMDGEDLKQVSDTAQWFPLILMEPNSHQLVSGAPDMRRRYLDWTVFHVKHAFLADWRRYARALRQRNAALRAGQRDLVASLDPQLIQLGEALHAQREAVFGQLKPVFREMVDLMSPDLGGADVILSPGWKADSLAKALSDSLERDLEQGFTRAGPHRADLLLRVRDRAVRDRLSRGEQKILAASLLLAQGAYFAGNGERPLILLDDLASEFDRDHLQRVVETCLSLGAQLWVTGTEAAPYDFVPGEQRMMFHVKHGEIDPP